MSKLTPKQEHRAKRLNAFREARDKTYEQLQVVCTLAGQWGYTFINDNYKRLMKANGYTLSAKVGIAVGHHHNWVEKRRKTNQENKDENRHNR